MKNKCNFIVVIIFPCSQLEECGLWTSNRYPGKHLACQRLELLGVNIYVLQCPSLNIYVLHFGMLVLWSKHYKHRTALT